MTEPAPKVLAAAAGEAALVRVEGRATFRLASAFRQALRAVSDGTDGTPVLVDMSAVTALDSTFMGAMATIGFQSKKPNAARVVFCGLTPPMHALLAGLGVDRVIEEAKGLSGSAADLSGLFADLKEVSAPTATATEQAAMMYDAHETLTRVRPENLAKFKDVLAFLKQDMNGK
jgi:anti-anti-sigma regulatory factor